MLWIWLIIIYIWGCSAKTLKITQAIIDNFEKSNSQGFQARVVSVAPNTNLTDTAQINSALRIVCGVVDPTLLQWHYVLSNTMSPHPDNGPFTSILLLLSIPQNLHPENLSEIFTWKEATLSETWWKEWCQNVVVPNKELIVMGRMELQRRTWQQLNWIRSRQGCFVSVLFIWKFDIVL